MNEVGETKVEDNRWQNYVFILSLTVVELA
jgi:hypothetical protein